VDHVGEVVGVGEARQVGGRLAGVAAAVEGEDEGPRGQLGQAPVEPGLGEDEGWAGVLEDRRQAQRRQIGRQGQVGASRLEHGEEALDHLEGALGREPDQHLRADPQPAQPGGRAVRPAVELAVGEGALGEDQGDGLRPRPRLLLEGLVQQPAGRALRRRGRVPLGEELVARGRREERKLGERGARRGDEAREERLELADEAPQGGAVEAAGLAGRLEDQVLAREGGQAQGVAGPALRAEHVPDLEALGGRGGEVLAARQVLEDHQALKQRPARRYLAPALEVGELHVLVLAPRGLRRLEPCEPGQERLVEVDRHPHRQGVDERPDDRLDAGQSRRPARHHAAEGDVPLAGEAGQKQRPGPLDQGVRGQPAPPRQRLEALPQRAREPPLDPQVAGPGGDPRHPNGRGAVRRGLGEPRPRFRQGGRRREALERPPPEGLVGRGVAAGEPVDVAAVGPGLAEVGRPPPAPGQVPREDLPQHQGHRPAVEQQVVVGPDDLHLAGTEGEGREAGEGSPAEVEAPAAVLLDPGGEAAPALAGGEDPPVLPRDGQGGVRDHHLERFLRALPEESGAQDRMAGEDRTPRRLEGIEVEVAAERPAHLHHVVAGARREEAVEEHAHLRRRQRVGVLDGGGVEGEGSGHGREEVRRHRAARGGGPRLGARRRGGGLRLGARCRLALPLPPEHPRQLRDGLVLKELPRGDGEARPARLGHDLDPHHRVAPQLEEVVVDAHPLDPQEPLPEAGQGPLDLALRRGVGRGEGGAGMEGGGGRRLYGGRRRSRQEVGD
jgi:hypothetical protein